MRRIDAIFCLFLAVLTIFTMNSCKDETEEVVIDYSYFPTEMGKPLVYQVDSVIYDLFANDVYTQTSWVKEEIVKMDTDLSDRERYHVHHFEKSDFTQSWSGVSPRTWYTIKTPSQIERVEENLRFIKMTFPISTETNWYGNHQIDTNEDRWEHYANWEYKYENIGESYTLSNGNSFDNTVTVNIFESESLINPTHKWFIEEVYAKDVGLIYREITNLRLSASELPLLEDFPWPDRANDGEIVKWELLEF